MTARRAAAALAVLGALLAGCARTGAHEPPAATSEPSPSITQAHADPADHDHEHEHEHHDVPAPELPIWDEDSHAQALARAEGFMRAWARPDLDTTAWLTGVRGFLSPSAVEGFLWTDPAFIPATQVTGPAHLAADPSATTATVRVPTDAGDHDVLLVRPDAQTAWMVAQLTPAEDPAP